MNLDWSRMGEMEYIDRMGRDGLELFRRNKKVVIVGSFVFVFIFVFVSVSVSVFVLVSVFSSESVVMLSAARVIQGYGTGKPPS